MNLSAYGASTPKLDPAVLVPYLAQATKHLGLVPLSVCEYTSFLLARLAPSITARPSLRLALGRHHHHRRRRQGPCDEAYRWDVRRAAAAAGRDPDRIKVLFLLSHRRFDDEGDTRAAATRIEAEKHVDMHLSGMSRLTGIDFSKVDLMEF
jgi:alkanesulfonate monooxygenase SsuD/methylene tetrahydromethanopterin reductase-like flavin-dependent oxidoreductase (luciferase family)